MIKSFENCEIYLLIYFSWCVINLLYLKKACLLNRDFSLLKNVTFFGVWFSRWGVYGVLQLNIKEKRWLFEERNKFSQQHFFILEEDKINFSTFVKFFLWFIISPCFLLIFESLFSEKEAQPGSSLK